MAKALLDRTLDRVALIVLALGIVGGIVCFGLGAPRTGAAALGVAVFVSAPLYYGPFEWLAITRHRHR